MKEQFVPIQLTIDTDFIWVFQNKGIFIQLNELDQLDKVVHAWISIHLQHDTSTADT